MSIDLDLSKLPTNSQPAWLNIRAEASDEAARQRAWVSDAPTRTNSFIEGEVENDRWASSDYRGLAVRLSDDPAFRQEQLDFLQSESGIKLIDNASYASWEDTGNWRKPSYEMSNVKLSSIGDPLQLALLSGNEQRSIELLNGEHGQKLSAQQRVDALDQAIEIDMPQVSRSLLEMGVNPLQRDANQNSFLDKAVVNDRVECAAVLLEHGAEVNAFNKFGTRPIFQTSSQEMADLLVANGADLSAFNYEGRTPLHDALDYGRSDRVQMFLNAGADMSVHDSQGRNALEFAQEERNFVVQSGGTGDYRVRGYDEVIATLTQHQLETNTALVAAWSPSPQQSEPQSNQADGETQVQEHTYRRTQRL